MPRKDACPRCTAGKLIYEADIFAPELVCLNCGYRVTVDEWRFAARRKAAETPARVPAAA